MMELKVKNNLMKKRRMKKTKKKIRKKVREMENKNKFQ